MQTAEFDAERLEARAGEGGTTSTELADTLAREHGVPFKTAHTIAVKVLKARRENPQAELASVLAAVCFQTLGRPLPYTEEDLQRILSPRHFVEVRRTLGGPAPEETGRALRRLEGAARSRSRVARPRAATRWRGRAPAP